jgi:hypothetical protein
MFANSILKAFKAFKETLDNVETNRTLCIFGASHVRRERNPLNRKFHKYAVRRAKSLSPGSPRQLPARSLSGGRELTGVGTGVM